MTEKTWVEAIKAVLLDANSALHYTEIARLVIDGGYRRNVGANPAMTVASVLATHVKKANSPFKWVRSGEYALKEFLAASAEPSNEANNEVIVEEEDDGGLLAAFGMFWRREEVLWDGSGQLWGRAELGGATIDFSKQSGIYLLHDRDRVIYVGQANRTLFARLKAHTADRLGGRWDRFSWFGIRKVGENGSLYDSKAAPSTDIVIDTLEAVMIESLEPPLNRRRGENLAALEFLQALDPEVRKRQELRVLEKITRAARY